MSSPERSLPERRASQAIFFLALLLVFTEILATAIFWSMPSWRYSQSEKAALILVGLSVAAGLLFVARAIAQRAVWARRTGIALGLLSLPAFPLGTLFGGYLLLHLVIRWESEPHETGGCTDA